jgi:hypothetical protein
MEDIGNLALYIILAIIAIAGSIQSSKKKKAAGRTAPPRQATQKAPGTAQKMTEPARQMQQQSRPQYVPPEPVNEGYYEDPVAEFFSGEGSVSRNSAAAYADEGSVSRNSAAAYADEGSVSRNSAAAFTDEGSIEDTMAIAFATEGVSALHDLTKDEFSHIDITDSEIADAPGYDYDADETAEQLAERFDLREAVIFSSILQRKEYSF